MLSARKIFLLKGKLQNYDWGGYEFLPTLLGIDNAAQEPYAEYWMGAHDSAPSQIMDGENAYSLNELIKKDPVKLLGKQVADTFGELPYLFKILDVKKMLSIQVHPSKAAAAKGFDAEEQAGIPLNAKHRNYKDRNHKPEVMIALSEFWLLHGFLKEEKLLEVLGRVDAFQPLEAYFNENGIKGLYQYVMEMPDAAADDMLRPLVEKVLAQKITDKSTPEYWVQQLFEGVKLANVQHFDKGIFSIYFFNIVKAEKGEAIFQGAGLPHAYLQGQNVELMANSDNVLRGGLTTKHIDVPELLSHTSFEGIVPQALQPEANGPEKVFHCPVPDFGISEIRLKAGESITLSTASLEILIVLQGACSIASAAHSLELKSGLAAMVLPEAKYRIAATQDMVIYKSFVP